MVDGCAELKRRIWKDIQVRWESGAGFFDTYWKLSDSIDKLREEVWDADDGFHRDVNRILSIRRRKSETTGYQRLYGGRSPGDRRRYRRVSRDLWKNRHLWGRRNDTGSNFADVPSTGKYTYSERAIPYVENEAPYHTGTFNNVTYFDKIDAIKNGDMDGLNTILSREGILMPLMG